MRAGVRTVIAVILGNILYALTVQLFLEPAGLPTGGTTGIALFVRAFTGIPISAFVLLFNTAMLLWGWRVLGRKFFFATVLSSLVYPVSLAVLERLLSGVALTDNIMLNTIFSGLGIGASLGIVIREGASTGGCDIPPLILHKKTGISVSGILSGMDYGILLLQAFSNPPEKILYGFLVILLYSLTMDRILLSGAQKTGVSRCLQAPAALPGRRRPYFSLSSRTGSSLRSRRSSARWTRRPLWLSAGLPRSPAAALQ